MPNTFVWASPHKPSQEQLDSLGKVVFLSDINADLQRQLSNLDMYSDLDYLAKELIFATKGMVLVQPAGSPAFQRILGKWLERTNPKDRPMVIYAFSKRMSVDVPQADGSVIKTVIFKHEGWI